MKYIIHVKLLLIVLLLVLCTTVVQCKTIYVKSTGNDSNTGESWLLAKKTIQAAITASVSGE